MDIKKIIIENAYEFEKDRFIIGLGNIDQIITEINQALQLQQTGVKQSVCYCKKTAKEEIAISIKALTNPDWKE